MWNPISAILWLIANEWSCYIIGNQGNHDSLQYKSWLNINFPDFSQHIAGTQQIALGSVINGDGSHCKGKERDFILITVTAFLHLCKTIC